MKTLIYLVSEKYTHPPVLMGKLIAEATGTELNVLVLIDREGHQENADSVVEQVRHDLAGLNPQIKIASGKAGLVLKDELEREQYQLVIVNADRINRIRKPVDIDPVLVKQSRFSLLLTQNPKPKLKQILLCSGCKEDDYILVEQAALLARDLEAKITLLHVFPGAVPSMYTGLEQIEETVDEILQTDTPYAQYLRRGIEILHKNQIESEVKIRRGIPIEEIVRETQLVSYDLVVIGSSRFNKGLIEMLMGNLTQKIIDRVELPVLVIGTRTLA